MGKVFRLNNRESSILRKIGSSKEQARKEAINSVKDNAELLASKVTMRLIEDRLVKTISKNLMEEQILKCLNQLCRADTFDIDYKISIVRNLIERPNVISLYITAFVLETLINHKSTIDIYGTDRDIYICIDEQIHTTC